MTTLSSPGGTSDIFDFFRIESWSSTSPIVLHPSVIGVWNWTILSWTSCRRVSKFWLMLMVFATLVYLLTVSRSSWVCVWCYIQLLSCLQEIVYYPRDLVSSYCVFHEILIQYYSWIFICWKNFRNDLGFYICPSNSVSQAWRMLYCGRLRLCLLLLIGWLIWFITKLKVLVCASVPPGSASFWCCCWG